MEVFVAMTMDDNDYVSIGVFELYFSTKAKLTIGYEVEKFQAK